MTTEEFSDQFDDLLSSYGRFKKFDDQEILDSVELNEYEKSVFLTKAQNELLLGLYSGRSHINNSYEQTEEMRRYLSSLNRTEIIIAEHNYHEPGLSPVSRFYKPEGEFLFITQEQCEVNRQDSCEGTLWLSVRPVKRDEYNILKNNPFKNNKIWRVDRSMEIIELISYYEIIAYKLSYLSKPSPIVLEDLVDITIEGISERTECSLPSSLHHLILELAVENVLKYKSIYAQSTEAQQE